MIVVKVELWPFGQEELAKTLGVATITNDGTGTQDSGNYVAQLFKETRYARPWKKARVREFARETLSSWDLLYRVLDKVVSEGKP